MEVRSAASASVSPSPASISKLIISPGFAASTESSSLLIPSPATLVPEVEVEVSVEVLSCPDVLIVDPRKATVAVFPGAAAAGGDMTSCHVAAT